jgi:hypothetical protein
LVLFATLALCTQICSADEALYHRAADCATADQLFVADAIPSLKPDDETGTKLLLRQVELGLSFAGTAYKKGLREPLASDLLKQSKERLLLLEISDREAFRASCNKEAQALWDAANGFERWIVKGKAKSGLRQMIEELKISVAVSNN